MALDLSCHLLEKNEGNYPRRQGRRNGKVEWLIRGQIILNLGAQKVRTAARQEGKKERAPEPLGPEITFNWK